MAANPKCNCMILFDPPLPPIEHADDCRAIKIVKGKKRWIDE